MDFIDFIIIILVFLFIVFAALFIFTPNLFTQIIKTIILGPALYMTNDEAGIFIDKHHIFFNIIYDLHNILPILTIATIIGLLIIMFLKKVKKDNSILWMRLLIAFIINLVIITLIKIITSFSGYLPETRDISLLQRLHLKFVSIIIYIINILVTVLISKSNKKEKQTSES